MRKDKKDLVTVQGTMIGILQKDKHDYISLTDIAKYKNPDHADDVIRNWLRNRNTLELLGVWERLNNPGFNPVEFDGIKTLAGLNSFTLTPKQWIEQTGAVGLVSRAGRYGGTYAHKDIAFEFASWVSVEFKLYLIKEFQRLKDDENNRLSLAWNLNRTLSKLNYRIHTDAIKAHLMVLANLESLNAEFIRMGLTQGERLQKLNATAIRQLQSLSANFALRRLGGADEESVRVSRMNAYPIRVTVSQQLRSLDPLARLLQKNRGNAAVPPSATARRAFFARPPCSAVASSAPSFERSFLQ